MYTCVFVLSSTMLFMYLFTYIYIYIYVCVCVCYRLLYIFKPDSDGSQTVGDSILKMPPGPGAEPRWRVWGAKQDKRFYKKNSKLVVFT